MATEDTHLHFEGRYTHLDSRVNYLDSRVNEMVADLASIKTGQDSLVRSVQALLDRASNPAPTNWIGIGSLLLAIMVGGGGYVQLTIDPVKANVLELQKKDQANDDLHSLTTAQLARQTEAMSFIREDQAANWASLVRLREVIGKNLKETGKVEARLEDLADDVNQIDIYGSRAWVDGKNKREQ